MRRTPLCVAVSSATLISALAVVGLGAGTPVAADPAPVLEGVVTDAAGDPVSGVWVTASENATFGYFDTYTDATGAFSLTVSPGDWVVQYQPPSGSGLLAEFWDDVETWAEATPVPVTTGTSVLDAELSEAGSLSGVVTDDGGDPVESVSVSLYGSDGWWLDTTTTDASGAYSFAEVSRRSVTIYFEPPVNSGHAAEYHLDAATLTAATPVAMVGAVTVDASLRSLGRLHGTVTLPDGSPAEMAQVSIFESAPVSGDGHVVDLFTDASGAFSRFVEPGSYVVRVSPPFGTEAATRWFDDAVRRAGATAVSVAAGGQTQVDQQLGVAGSVSGTVTAAGGVPVADVQVDIYTADDQYLTGVTTAADGTYTATGVSAPEVKIQFTPPFGSPLIAEYHLDAATAAEATIVDLTGAPQVVDAQLDALGRVSGTVSLTGGAPAVGSTVTLEGVVGVFGEYSTQTDGSGAYAFEELPAGSYRLGFQAPPGTNWMPEFHDGAVSASEATPVVVANGSDQTIDATLALGGSVSGVVLDSAGAPLENASVTLDSVIHEATYQTSTDDAGEFTVRGMLPSSYEVRFRDTTGVHFSEYFDGQRRRVDATYVGVLEGQDVLGVDAQMTRASTISGVVTDELGAPIESAEVTAEGTVDGFGSVWTESDGSFTIRGLEADDYVVSVTADGYVSEFWDNASSIATAEAITVAASTDVTGIDIELASAASGGSISGTITDTLGAPIENVFVAAIGENDSGFGMTDVDGDYLISGLDADDYRVYGSASGYTTRYYPDSPTAAGATPVTVASASAVTGIDIALVPGGTVSGTVSTADGGSLADVFVSLNRVGGGTGYSAEVDPVTGGYSFTGIAAGTYLVGFAPYGTSPYLPEYHDDVADVDDATPIVVTSGGVITGLDAVLALGGSISGTVTDGAGDPVPDVDVTIRGVDTRSTQTDTNGNYTVRRLRAGQYTVGFDPRDDTPFLDQWFDGVSDEDSATQVSVTLGVATPGIDAVLGSGLTLSGRVTGPGGAAVSSGTVQLQPQTGVWRTTSIASDGTYSFAGLTPGSYCVVVRHEGLPGDLIGEFFGPTPDSCTVASRIALSADRNDIDIQLENGGTISGRVTGVGGTPLAGVGVHVGDPAFGESRSTLTASDGTYTITGLAPGSNVLYFAPGVGSPYLAEYYDDARVSWGADPITFTRGGALTGYDAELALAATITGRVTDTSGAGVADVTVTALSSGSFAGSATTDENGDYALDRLWAGSHVIEFESPDPSLLSEFFDDAPSQSAATPVTVGAGGTAVADAVLDPASSVSGSVTDPVGVPIAGVSVTAWPASGGSLSSAVTAADGSYTVGGLRAGGHTIEFRTSLTSPFSGEWYDNASSQSSATVVTVGVDADVTDIDAELARRGSIEGVVTDQTGAPLQGASVSIIRTDVPPSSCFTCTVSTASDGSYSFPLVDAGTYVVRVRPPFARPDLAAEWYSNAYVRSAASSVVVQPAIATEADVQLAIGAVVNGVVSDPAGDPVAGATVVLSHAEDGRFTTTQVDGTYSFTGVMPGPATIQVWAPWSSDLADEWFEDAYSSDDATPLSLALGVTTEADVELNVGATITGRVTDDDGAPVEDACVDLGDISYDCLAVTDASGEYELRGVNPGTAVVCVSAPVEAGLGAECYGGALSGQSATSVPVALGVTRSGVDFELDPTGDLTVELQDESGQSIGGFIGLFDGAVSADPQDDITGFLTFRSTGPGGVTIEGLTAGTYRLLGSNFEIENEVLPTAVVTITPGGVASVVLRYGDPVTVPDAPGTPTGTPAAGSVSLAWSAPTQDGGSPITDYVVQFSSNNGSTWGTFADGVSSSTGATVTGLTNGTPYRFRVAAVNAVGTGDPSTSSGPVTPRTVPGPPVSLSGTPVSGGVVLTWSAPSSDGGASITDYVVQFSSNNGSTWGTFADGVSSSTGATVTGLTNGTPYRFRVAAVNAAGTGSPSAVSAPVTPRTVPAAPAAPRGTAGVGRVVLSWSAPSSNGGSSITDYVVQFSSNNGSTWSTFNDGVRSTTGATVTGLTNGRAYVFRVAAKNVAGTGAYSSRSAVVTPRTVPGAPRSLAGRAGRRSVVLTWSAPTSNGGATITDYVVQFSSNNGSTWRTFNDGVRSSTGATVTGLTAGTAYVFRVAAKNVAGTGAYTAKSATVRPR